jgi:hypothetical protein
MTETTCPKTIVLATDEEILKGCETFYGVPITECGEEGDAIVAIGHYEPKRFLAAALALGRDRGWDADHLNLRLVEFDEIEKSKAWRLIYRHADAATVGVDYLEYDCICDECHWCAVEAAESTPNATPVMWWVI